MPCDLCGKVGMQTIDSESSLVVMSANQAQNRDQTKRLDDFFRSNESKIQCRAE